VLILTGIARSSGSSSPIISVRFNSGTGSRALSYLRFDDGSGGVSSLQTNDTNLIDLDIYGSSSSANAAGLFGFFRYEFRNASSGGSKASGVGFLGTNRTALNEAFFQADGPFNQISVFHGAGSGASFVSGSKVLLFGIK
jgi:hypothetical protein